MDSITQISTDEQGNQVATIGKYKLTILKPLCIGATSCVAIAPEVFQINDQNIAEFIASGSLDPTTLLLAAQACPIRAIIIEDVITHEQLWPPTKVH
jgi:ferredoxin